MVRLQGKNYFARNEMLGRIKGSQFLFGNTLQSWGDRQCATFHWCNVPRLAAIVNHLAIMQRHIVFLHDFLESTPNVFVGVDQHPIHVENNHKGHRREETGNSIKASLRGTLDLSFINPFPRFCSIPAHFRWAVERMPRKGPSRRRWKNGNFWRSGRRSALHHCKRLQAAKNGERTRFCWRG